VYVELTFHATARPLRTDTAPPDHCVLARYRQTTAYWHGTARPLRTGTALPDHCVLARYWHGTARPLRTGTAPPDHFVLARHCQTTAYWQDTASVCTLHWYCHVECDWKFKSDFFALLSR